MKRVIKALLAASMLMPIAAQAQEQDGRGSGQGRRGEWGQRGDRPERSAEVGIDAQVRAERPRRADVQADRRQAPAPQPDRGDRDARGWNRPDGNRQNGDRPDRQRDDRQPGGDWNRRDPAQAGNGWRQPDRGDRRDDRPDNRDGRDWRDGRDGRRPGFVRNDDRSGGGWRGDDGRGWNDGRRYDNRGGAWNRGWRNDTRYDWNRYRQANRGAYRLPRYYAPSGWGQGYRRYSVGVSLSSILFNRNYWIEDPYSYRLPEAYGPYRWVRYYDDALLVDIRSGQVVDSVYGIFY
ncbi:Ni/Co efflux regulator RcnB [Sphingomonas insulae]|nr:RcnB family protein [Sphingomonas insulae]NIJ29583.1 Ni/Co efflux regulator RcnB [Sphingomonas insulae]